MLAFDQSLPMHAWSLPGGTMPGPPGLDATLAAAMGVQLVSNTAAGMDPMLHSMLSTAGTQVPGSFSPTNIGHQGSDVCQLMQQLQPSTAAFDQLAGTSPTAASPVHELHLLQDPSQQQQFLHYVDAASVASSAPLVPGLSGIAPEAWQQTAPSHTSAMPTSSSCNSSPNNAMLQQQQQPITAPGVPRVFIPESLKNTVGAPAAPNQQLLSLLQTLLAQQATANSSNCSTPAPGAADTASLLSLLQQQLLLQSLQQQNAAGQASLQTALLAALLGQAGPPGLQPLASNGINAAGGNAAVASLLPLLTGALSDPNAAATIAAALLAAQQQQAVPLGTGLASAAGISPMLGGGLDQSLLQQLLLPQAGAGLPGTAGAGSPAAAGIISQLQPWAVKALASQLQQQGLGVNSINQQLSMANLLNPAGAAVPSTSTSLPRANSGSSNGQHARRRSSRRSSGCSPAESGFVLSSLNSSSRAGSTAGSEVALAADNKATPVLHFVPAGLSSKDLCPSRFEEFWGASDEADEAVTTTNNAKTAASLSGTGSWVASASSSDLSSTAAGASLCGSGVSTCSSSRVNSAGSDDKWQWDSHFCSLDEDAAAKGSSGIAGRACRRQAGASKDQNSASGAGGRAEAKQLADSSAAADSSKRDQDAGKGAVGGCPVWYPGAREAAGDDSWYLPKPPTCRLFVGNIGCWVDENMLMAYFGKYGHVVDVQVMWNTKMLARGRRVNREFAFISYSTPEEAARAVHWLDGCRLADLEKDKNGVTVEYENGEGEGPATKQ